VAGRLADTLDAPKAVLAACSALAALIATGYLRAPGFLLLFVVGVLHSAALAPLAPLADTLALGSAAPGASEVSARRRFHYGWLRGAGSAAFICGTCSLVRPSRDLGSRRRFGSMSDCLPRQQLPRALSRFC
jgi:PPP family 3-phenylpropionic acid transporter